MFVIGTAGHVDHGKSTLIERLTGIDPDRLISEKDRGMTIELGFAWLDLGDGNEVSIVDVPGHERFVKTMLMGAGGFDLVLLVVAGDEGPMPQTLEHLAIIDLLDVRDGIVVVTKSDLADPDLIELIELEVSEILDGTSLEGASMITVSAETGEGMETLVKMIADFVEGKQPRTNNDRPRLFIDRSFSVAGFGAVVTGTLDGGELRIGDEVVFLPSNEQARVRGLQSHKSEIDVALPGTRVAVSVSGTSHTVLNRGEALVKRRQFQTVSVFDASLRAIGDVKRPITHNHRVTLYGGTWEEPATVRLLNANQLEAGEHGWAQIKIGNPRPIVNGDRFVIRDSNDTLGGGVVLVVDAPRHRRNDASVIDQLQVLSDGGSTEYVLHTLDRIGIATADQIATSGHLQISDVERDLSELKDAGSVLCLSPSGTALFVSAARYKSFLEQSERALANYHSRYPLRRGMPRQELRNRLDLTSNGFDLLVQRFVDDEDIAFDVAAVKLRDHQVRFGETEQREAEKFLSVLHEHRYSPPAWNKIDPELLGALVDCRQVVSAGPDVVFAAEVFDEMRDAVIGFCRANSEISINDVRELLGTSRKYSLALLEQLDRDNVTMRVGDLRKLR